MQLRNRCFGNDCFVNAESIMKFYNRTEEIASLREVREAAKSNAQFTVVTGRRRIGKTSLIWKAYEDEPALYFFVARKSEGELCEEYCSEIENKLKDWSRYKVL